ncbi:MAG: 4Fe-4S binding protein [Chthoniobacter sp.]
MNLPTYKTLDANEAVAGVAYALNEVIAIFPITPATPMGEWADQWASEGRKNLWGAVPSVVEMQSEGGAAGALHGAMQTGSLATTFTGSQGLLLMLPNMFKIAGELTPAVFHIASRALATQALSIFGDHSDVMAARSTGWAMLCSASVQEAQDFALIAQAATLETRLPFLHFFDGFRTSHEIAKIVPLHDDVLRAMLDEQRIAEHRARALSPEHPVLRGSSQNPDVYFQARETVNPFYAACPDIVQRAMDKFAALTGRQYRLCDYHGAPDAERVIVLMGSGGEAACETVDYLNGCGERVGVLQVRLYRPFDSERFRAALPSTVKALAVLDRTKEPGGPGEPLYLDGVQALYDSVKRPKIVGGRYGLASKEFTPAMIKAVFDNLAAAEPQNHFTVGIRDDLSGTSLDFDPAWSIERDDVFRAIFYGLGSDGTVGANKETIKIIGEKSGRFAQGYFVYDSKEEGRCDHRIPSAFWTAPHSLELPDLEGAIHRLPSSAVPGTFRRVREARPRRCLSPQLSGDAGPRLGDIAGADAAHAPRPAGAFLCRRRCQSGARMRTRWTDQYRDAGLFLCPLRRTATRGGTRRPSRVDPQNLWEERRRGRKYEPRGDRRRPGPHAGGAPGRRARRSGENPPTSSGGSASLRARCSWADDRRSGRYRARERSAVRRDIPTGSSRWEKRNLALEIPVWDADLCIQCAKCVMVCPHAVIRSKVYEPARLAGAPSTFQSREARLPEWRGLKFTLQVAPEDCTGCGLCVEVCPVRHKSEARLKAINMRPQPPLRGRRAGELEFLPVIAGTRSPPHSAGACALAAGAAAAV